MLALPRLPAQDGPVLISGWTRWSGRCPRARVSLRGDDVDETLHDRAGVVGAPGKAQGGGRHPLRPDERQAGPGVVDLGGGGTKADPPAGHDELAPLVDGPGNGTNDRLVPAGPGLHHPLITPAG